MRSLHRSARYVLVGALVLFCMLVVATPAYAAADWTWPVSGPVVGGYDPPASTYEAGHRGIDIAAPAGTVVVAPAPGSVTFAGSVGGHLFVTLAHAGGLSSTYSWVSALLVHKGDRVVSGQPIARSGSGHPGDVIANLHLGVKLDGAYVDPMLYLAPLDVGSFIRLAPI
jgi:murein DD-endopeptidase MepM/ murein hydrolase activator NlpD